MKKRSILLIMAAAVICCGIMALVDGVIRPGYAVKSGIKLALFLLVPVMISLFDRNIRYWELFRFKKKGLITALLLGAGVYGVILGGYFLVRPYFDFSGIADKLTANAGVNKHNFLYVSLYISYINSLLEEFFFRGFLFTNLRSSCSGVFAHGFSAGLFALYHVAMMIGWFSPWLFLLVMAGLTVGGVLFNLLNQWTGTVCCSWLVHMCANFAINTIGFMLL